MTQTLKLPFNMQPVEVDSPCLCKAEVAALARVSIKTIDRLRADGHVWGAIRVGKSVRFLKERVLAWLSAGCPRKPDPTQRHK